MLFLVFSLLSNSPWNVRERNDSISSLFLATPEATMFTRWFSMPLPSSREVSIPTCPSM